MQIKSLRIKSCRNWAIADTASKAAILALSSCHPRRRRGSRRGEAA